eukprot:TRINITY_DN4116_c0_g1_i1.p1 TRINITY_DN4116_c0_g1~~TRINITY_DN4116_c0_g1_i1.p1  ORF type:complete len:352 (+),score=68.90 TRINITY_DN4116_c0_g1_i1:107-1162(+)
MGTPQTKGYPNQSSGNPYTTPSNADFGGGKHFANSNYKRHLLAIPKAKVDEMLFHQCILDNFKSFGEQSGYNAYDAKMKKHPDEPPKLIATRVWTGSAVYPRLKGILMNDNDDGCKAMAPFMRALNRQLVCQSPKAMVTYRGSKMNKADIILLKEFWTKAKEAGVPLITRVPAYYASSTELSVAKRFSTHGFRVKFIIPDGCPNCCYIESWTEFKGEHEVLFPPWTAFRIDKVDIDGEYALELAVLDNMLQPETIQVLPGGGISAASAIVGISAITGVAGVAALASPAGLHAAGAGAVGAGIPGISALAGAAAVSSAQAVVGMTAAEAGASLAVAGSMSAALSVDGESKFG